MPVPVSVGRYEVLRRLATGGMADVFLAVDRGPHALDRLCVREVKSILSSYLPIKVKREKIKPPLN